MRSRSISVHVCDNHISVAAHQWNIKQPAWWMISQRQQTAVQVKRSWKDNESIFHRENAWKLLSKLSQPLLLRTCSYLILKMMCMTYKHVSVRTRSLACRIIEFALPICNVKVNILTASVLLSRGFIVNFKQFYVTWGMADFTAPVQWKHQTLLHPQTGGLLPEGAVQWTNTS